MNKKSLFIAVLFAVFSTVSFAEQPLTKELIRSFQEMSVQWQSLEKKYPELSASLDDIDLSNPELIIAQIKQSSAYPQIKSILTQHNFDSIDEYYNIAMRVMGGMMGYQMQTMTNGMDIDSMSQMLKQNLMQMKASNAPAEMIAQIEKQIAEMENGMSQMKEAMKKSSDADKKFFNDNAQWIMSVLDNL